MPRFQGAIFDVDGVLVDSPHEKAWRESLRELMESDWSDIRDRTTWSPEAFTSRVYDEQMSGKPRMSGARAALEYFHVPDDEEDHRLLEYAERKQKMVVRLIEAWDFTAYPDALRFIIAVKDAGMRVAAASSSKNAQLFLSQIRLDSFAEQEGISSATLRPGLTLLEYFDVDVSGRDFAHGKPDPEMFVTAAHELGVAPEAAIVMEDAAAGVEAAKAGGMGAIGIARKDDAALLAAAGADVVVHTLDEVDLDALSNGRLTIAAAAPDRSRCEGPSRGLDRSAPAIGGDGGAGDIARSRGGEEGDHLGDLLGRRGAMHRCGFAERRDELGTRGRRGIHRSRGGAHLRGGSPSARRCCSWPRTPQLTLRARESILGLPGVRRVGVGGPKQFRDLVWIERRPRRGPGRRL